MATIKSTVHEQERQLRDAIIRGLNYVPDPLLIEKVHARLSEYLNAKHRKHTPERLMVLDEIYGIDQPVDIITLQNLIIRDQGQLSLSSVYNTLNLLLDAHLVRRFDLTEGGMDFFERVIGEEPHGYAVCRECGSITRLTQPELLGCLQTQFPRGFIADDFVLTVHGICQRCQRRMKSNIHTKRKSN